MPQAQIKTNLEWIRKRWVEFHKNNEQVMDDESYTAQLFAAFCLEELYKEHEVEAKLTDNADSETKPNITVSCNRHSDCKQAVVDWLNKHPEVDFPPMNFYCYDDECEDCFGK